MMLSLKSGEGEEPMWWSVHARYGMKWKFFVYPAGEGELSLPADGQAGAIGSVVVGAVDRCGNESDRVSVAMKE